MSVPTADERFARLEAQLAAQLEAQREAASFRRTDSYRAPKLPVFFKTDPQTWFGQVEATFRNARITSQTTMADTVVAGLDSETASIDLGFRRPIEWNFCVAAVPYPIIGADLLTHYGLTVDLKGRRVVDSTTNICIAAGIDAGIADRTPSSVNVLGPSSKYAHILARFPQVIGLEQPTPLESRGVFHHISTTGPSVAERARRLAADKLKAAKAEFKHLIAAGICRPSSSPYTIQSHTPR